MFYYQKAFITFCFYSKSNLHNWLKGHWILSNWTRGRSEKNLNIFSFHIFKIRFFLFQSRLASTSTTTTTTARTCRNAILKIAGAPNDFLQAVSLSSHEAQKRLAGNFAFFSPLLALDASTWKSSKKDNKNLCQFFLFSLSLSHSIYLSLLCKPVHTIPLFSVSLSIFLFAGVVASASTKRRFFQRKT